MRLTMILLLAIFLNTVTAQETIDEKIIDDGKIALADSSSLSAYRKFVAHYKKFPKEENIQKMIAIGILGARIFKLEREFNFFAKYLQKTYPNSLYLEIVHSKNLSDQCQTCEGQGTAAKSCTKCKGNGTCTNHSCSDGQVTGYDRVDGRFVKVQRQCVICKGKGKCNTCDGSGESVGSCVKCRKTGLVYSEAKTIEVYEKLVKAIIDDSVDYNTKAKHEAMIAKGMVEIDGEFYTKEQVAKMEQTALAARKKADEAERRAMEIAEAQRKEQQAAGILGQVDSMLKDNPEETIVRLKTFLKDYPDHDRVSEVKRELEYCDLYNQAVTLEKKGSISKAIKKYQEILKFKESEDIQEKIKNLDYQTIGL